MFFFRPKMSRDDANDKRRDDDANSEKAEMEYYEQLLLKNQDLKAHIAKLKSELDLCKYNLEESKDLVRDQEEDIGNLRAIIKLQEKQLEHSNTINRCNKEIEDLVVKKSEFKEKLHFQML